MNYYNIYLSFIVIIKIVIVILAILHIYLKIKEKKLSELDKKIEFWKERLEFVFKVLMSLLLIYLFNPQTKSVVIDSETKTLLWLFGIILLLTAKWDDFFHESKLFSLVQSTLSN